MDRRLTGLDLKTSLSAIADLVLPRECVVCGRVLIPQEKHICLTCLADLPETHYAPMARNPMADKFNARIATDRYEPYAYAAALFHYYPDSDYSGITKALKYGRNFAAGKYFAGMLGRRLAASPLYADVDLVIPVPLHWTRRWSRGYNQAEIIAGELAAALRAPLRSGLLRRTRRTETQTRLSGEQKAANMAGAFEVPRKYRGGSPLSRRKNAATATEKTPAHILLVDDVFTSGSTLGECHKALRCVFDTQTRISAATLGFAGE